MQQKLETLYKQAKPYHIAYGRSWYRTAKAICEVIAEEHNLPTWKVVGIMAALSPMNKWERNIEDTKTFLKLNLLGKYCTFRANVEKAYRIHRAKNCYEVLSILNGNKVKSFFLNIYCPAINVVTIDRWALRSVDMGDVAITNKRYRDVSNAYKAYAKTLNMRPHELQAVIWGIVRGE